MPAARLIKYKRTERFNKAMEMRLRWRDVDMAERCGDMEFSVYRREGGALVERVANFKYLGRPLDQMDYNWPSVRWNVRRVRRGRRRLGKLTRREGVDPKVEMMVYRVVTYAVLLFGSETWVLFRAMERTVKGTHINFLRQITEKWV